MQRKLFTISAGLVLVLGACGDGGEPLELGRDTQGVYRVESSFSTPDGVPDMAAPDLARFVKLADHPENVGGWVLDLVEAELDSPLSDILKYVRVGVGADAKLSAFLAKEAPELVENITGLASDVRQLTSSLNLTSELFLTVAAEDAANFNRKTGAATHSVVGVVYRLGDNTYEYSLSEMGMAPSATAVTDYEVFDDGTSIGFGAQDHALAYGEIMNFGLNEVIIDARDPQAADMAGLVATYVPCDRVGDWIDGELHIGSGEIFTSACASAVEQLVADLVPAPIPDIAATLHLETGDAQIVDNADGSLMSGFENGVWQGQLLFDSATVRLRRPEQSFRGTRQ